MKRLFLLPFILLSLTTCGQDEPEITDKAQLVLRTYLSGNFETFSDEHFPSAKAWDWLKHEWNLKDSTSYEDFVYFLKIALTEQRQSYIKHRIPLTRVSIDSLSYLGKTVDIFLGTRKIGGVETCRIFLSKGKSRYAVNIGLFKHEEKLYYYPENGIQISGKIK